MPYILQRTLPITPETTVTAVPDMTINDDVLFVRPLLPEDQSRLWSICIFQVNPNFGAYLDRQVDYFYRTRHWVSYDEPNFSATLERVQLYFPKGVEVLGSGDIVEVWQFQ